MYQRKIVIGILRFASMLFYIFEKGIIQKLSEEEEGEMYWLCKTLFPPLAIISNHGCNSKVSKIKENQL